MTWRRRNLARARVGGDIDKHRVSGLARAAGVAGNRRGAHKYSAPHGDREAPRRRRGVGEYAWRWRPRRAPYGGEGGGVLYMLDIVVTINIIAPAMLMAENGALSLRERCRLWPRL